MLWEHQVGVHADSTPSCHHFVEQDEAFSYFHFYCEFRPEVLPVASAACEKCCFRLCTVEMDILSTGPLDTLCCVGLMFFDHLVHILCSCHPSEVVYEGEANGLHSIFDALYQSDGVDCEHNR